MNDACNGASWDILHEDGNHMLLKRGTQEANNVDVSEGFKQLHLPLQTTVFFICSISVRGIEDHLLHSY